MKNSNQLALDRCPQCGIAAPTISAAWQGQAAPRAGGPNKHWFVYFCASCGGAILTRSISVENAEIAQMWPSQPTAAEELPPRARDYLNQALSTIHAPAGSVMLTASAIDAMLKDQGLKDGSLNARIDTAAKNHLITQEMAAWAHEIRLGVCAAEPGSS